MKRHQIILKNPDSQIKKIKK